MNRRLASAMDRAKARAADGQNYAEAKGNGPAAQPPAELTNPRSEASHARIAANIAREWWVVTLGAHTVEVFFHPPQTLAEVRTLYPKAEVAPR